MESQIQCASTVYRDHSTHHHEAEFYHNHPKLEQYIPGPAECRVEYDFRNVKRYVPRIRRNCYKDSVTSRTESIPPDPLVGEHVLVQLNKYRN